VRPVDVSGRPPLAARSVLRHAQARSPGYEIFANCILATLGVVLIAVVTRTTSRDWRP
jgi:hypothetical protein